MSTWLGNTKCECCHRDATNVADRFYDCKTSFGGRWALLCAECFQKIGMGIGTGLGQQYDSTTRQKTGG